MVDLASLREAKYPTQPGKKVVIQGLENFIVVENEDVLLICPKNAEQDIKEISLDVKNIFGKEYT